MTRTVLAICAMQALLVLAGPHGAKGERTPDAVDDRSQEILKRTCSTEASSQELTFFNNGTLRLKQWQDGEQQPLLLAELNRQEVRAYIRRLKNEDLSESDDSGGHGMEGMGTERCEVLIQVDESAPLQTIWYGRFDTHSLAESRLLSIVDELAEVTRLRAPTSSIPGDYVPEHGDLLTHLSGIVYEVVVLTSDGDGVELIGVDDPTVLYIRVEAIRDEFVSVEKRSLSW